MKLTIIKLLILNVKQHETKTLMAIKLLFQLHSILRCKIFIKQILIGRSMHLLYFDTKEK